MASCSCKQSADDLAGTEPPSGDWEWIAGAQAASWRWTSSNNAAFATHYLLGPAPGALRWGGACEDGTASAGPNIRLTAVYLRVIGPK